MTSSLQEVPPIRVLIAVILVPLAFFGLNYLFPHFTVSFLVRELTILGFAGLFVFYCLTVEGLSPSAIGFRRTPVMSICWGIALGVALLLLGAAVIFAIRALDLHKDTTALRMLVTKNPAWVLVLSSVAAAIAEEISYRGVLIDHVGALLEGQWGGALVSIFLFTLGHVRNFGVVQVLIVAPIAIVLTAYYLWKRDVVACIIAHAMTDSISFLTAVATHRV